MLEGKEVPSLLPFLHYYILSLPTITQQTIFCDTLHNMISSITTMLTLDHHTILFITLPIYLHSLNSVHSSSSIFSSITFGNNRRNNNAGQYVFDLLHCVVSSNSSSSSDMSEKRMEEIGQCIGIVINKVSITIILLLLL